MHLALNKQKSACLVHLFEHRKKLFLFGFSNKEVELFLGIRTVILASKTIFWR